MKQHEAKAEETKEKAKTTTKEEKEIVHEMAKAEVDRDATPPGESPASQRGSRRRPYPSQAD